MDVGYDSLKERNNELGNTIHSCFWPGGHRGLRKINKTQESSVMSSAQRKSF